MRDQVLNAMSPTTYLSSGVAFIASVNLNQWLAIVSICVALGSFGINWYYQHKRFQLLKSDS